MAYDTPNYYSNVTPDNKLVPDEGLRIKSDPLELKIDDKDLIKTVDKDVKDYEKFYKSNYNLISRRRKNEVYYLGRQIQEKEEQGSLKDYETRNLDNILYEIVATQQSLAMSQLPDLIVTPGEQTDEKRETAKLLTRAVDSDIKRRNNRKVLALAAKHRRVYFVGVIKAVWNPELAGGLGDYQFIVVHPDNIEFDFTATEADAEKMKYVFQVTEMTVKEAFMKFPKAKEKLMEQLSRDGLVAKDQKPSWKALASTIKIREGWFDEYETLEEGKVRKVSGLLWKYKDVILGKMKNPNFDYEGEEQVFVYEDKEVKSSRRALSLPEMQQSMVTGMFPANVKKETIYHNYFENPRKPYFFMVYDQWGKQPLDETSDLEQNVRNQEALDSMVKIIQEKLKNRGHHIWSKNAGFKPDDIEKMDHNNPDEDYLVDGDDITKVHAFITGEQVTPAEFNEMDRLQNRMFSLSGANAVRGELKANTPATSTQIAREANYTRADDEVENTINAAAEWMAQWALQFIKLRYTQEHFRKILGKKGEVVFLRLHQNMIDDGMEVMIKASGTDKIKAQNQALEMAKMQLTDPLSFFTDMGLDDPEGRTVKLLMFTKDPAGYLQQFIESNPSVTPELLAKLQVAATPPPPQGLPGQLPTAPGQPPTQGMPQGATVTNTSATPAQPPTGVTASPSTTQPLV
jgi:hypothetical protein